MPKVRPARPAPTIRTLGRSESPEVTGGFLCVVLLLVIVVIKEFTMMVMDVK